MSILAAWWARDREVSAISPELNMNTWKNKPERGSTVLIRLMAWLAVHLGRGLCRALLYPIVFYFFLSDRIARTSSAEFLTALTGAPARFHDVFGHIYAFAATLLDRVYMSAGHFERFELTIENQHLVDEALHNGRGCVLLGAHLGSFDLLMLAMREMDPRSLSVLMHLDPRARTRRIAGVDDTGLDVIPLGTPNSLLRAYSVLQRGGIVATLADRVDGSAALMTTFLGRPVEMAIAPHVLAARSRATTLMCLGLYEGANRYRIVFLDGFELASAQARGSDFQPLVDRYTHLLERYTRDYPQNWFNFYPYWDAKGRRL